MEYLSEFSFIQKMKSGELSIPELRELPNAHDIDWKSYLDEGKIHIMIVGNSTFFARSYDNHHIRIGNMSISCLLYAEDLIIMST